MTTDQETTIRETAKRLGWNENRQGSTGTKYWLSDVYIMTRYSLNGRLTFAQRAKGSDLEEIATADKYKTLLRWLNEVPVLAAARNGEQAQPVTEPAAPAGAEMHWVLTISWTPQGEATRQTTVDGCTTFSAGATRKDMYRWIVRYVAHDVKGIPDEVAIGVLFFALEPNSTNYRILEKQ